MLIEAPTQLSPAPLPSRNQQILARARSPKNVARLLDAGTTDDGLPYFIMDYIVAHLSDSICSRAKAVDASRLVLFLKICAALNLRIGISLFIATSAEQHSGEREGDPRLLDFGHRQAPGESRRRGAIDCRGTAASDTHLRFARQAKEDPITVATDIYSLGALAL